MGRGTIHVKGFPSVGPSLEVPGFRGGKLYMMREEGFGRKLKTFPKGEYAKNVLHRSEMRCTGGNGKGEKKHRF